MQVTDKKDLAQLVKDEIGTWGTILNVYQVGKYVVAEQKDKSTKEIIYHGLYLNEDGRLCDTCVTNETLEDALLTVLGEAAGHQQFGTYASRMLFGGKAVCRQRLSMTSTFVFVQNGGVKS